MNIKRLRDNVEMEEILRRRCFGAGMEAARSRPAPAACPDDREPAGPNYFLVGGPYPNYAGPTKEPS